MMDVLTELAELAFATRLKRLSERLVKDVSAVYHKLGLDFEGRWFSVFYTLSMKSPMMVTELAQSLRLTHTTINQLAAEMIKKGLIVSFRGTDDERQRLLAITPAGKELALKLAPIWEEIRRATKELIDSTGSDVLASITTIEQQLNEQDMYERVWIRLKGNPPGEIVIREYSAAMKKYFKSLNYEWLEEYFEVEKGDEQILSYPKEKIVNRGGSIFFACRDDQVVGTCALIQHRDGTLELAKMAVTKKFQGRGIGKMLMQKIIDRAKELGGSELFLQTNARLKAANHLYQQFGFKKTKHNPFEPSRYQRSTFVMKLDLKDKFMDYTQ